MRLRISSDICLTMPQKIVGGLPRGNVSESLFLLRAPQKQLNIGGVARISRGAPGAPGLTSPDPVEEGTHLPDHAVDSPGHQTLRTRTRLSTMEPQELATVLMHLHSPVPVPPDEELCDILGSSASQP
jgi:hypothetical protein